MKGYLQEIHPVLPVKDVKVAFKYYVEKLGFEIAFADDNTNPYYVGIKRDAIGIHLQCHNSKEWDAVERSILRFVTQNIEDLFDDYKTKGVFHKNTSLKETLGDTREFAFYGLYKNGLTFYQDL